MIKCKFAATNWLNMKLMGFIHFGQRFVVKDHAKDIKNDFLNYEDQPVVIAGRLMTMRSHGKTAFANIRDLSGDIQVYFRKDVLGEDNYKYVKMLDIGDIVGIEGHVFKTHSGEVTIKVDKLTLLSKHCVHYLKNGMA